MAIDSSSEAVTQPVLASTKAQSVPLTAIQIGAVGALQAQVNSTLPAINMGSANTAATQASAIKTALANDLPVSRFAASLVTRVLAGFGAVYLSLSTLCGGVCPEIEFRSNIARMLALFEGITAMFYVTILIARLVALSSERSRS